MKDYFTQDYTKLHMELYSFVDSKNQPNPEWIYFNKDLAISHLLHHLYTDEGLSLLTGTLKNYPYYAQAYAGHQYGYFTKLGDGRALNIGDFAVSDKKYDLQLKGSGLTPYSRRGDGQATLFSMLKELLISEGLHYLNVPTTRTLSVIKTNKQVQREVLHQGAIASRVASSHVRIGTIEYASEFINKKAVKELLDFVKNRHYPHVTNYQELTQNIIQNQAKLVAKWQSIGFIHGVLNTDNVLLSGEAIDFGPCAFLDTYNPNTVYSSIDRNGRYRYANQPAITSWNLSKLLERIYPFFDDDQDKAISIANELLASFEKIYLEEYYQLFSKKIGLRKPNKPLVDELLMIMEKEELDFTNFFSSLTTSSYDLTLLSSSLQNWIKTWKTNDIDMTLMKEYNPVVIPRNHIVLEALENAAFSDDYSLFEELWGYLKDPYNYELDIPEKFKQPNPQDESFVTYCGT